MCQLYGTNSASEACEGPWQWETLTPSLAHPAPEAHVLMVAHGFCPGALHAGSSGFLYEEVTFLWACSVPSRHAVHVLLWPWRFAFCHECVQRSQDGGRRQLHTAMVTIPSTLGGAWSHTGLSWCGEGLLSSSSWHRIHEGYQAYHVPHCVIVLGANLMHPNFHICPAQDISAGPNSGGWGGNGATLRQTRTVFPRGGKGYLLINMGPQTGTF